MKYTDIKSLPEHQFKRLIGIKPSTFHQMIEVLNAAQPEHQRGRPAKLAIEEQLLLTLSYWREYRTLFHTAMSFGIHESSASRIIQKIENILIKSNLFHLPKKLPCGEGVDWEVVVVDATEMNIERPKKTKEILYWQKETAQHKSTNHDSLQQLTNTIYSLLSRENA